MKRLELSVAADADLFDILAYGTSVHGEAASDAYFSGLAKAFSLICENPALGRREVISGFGLRRWRFRRHHIFYRSTAHTILIVRVLHVAADSVRHLKP